MKKYFNVNYKKYVLFYTEEQKAKIDYMKDWKHTIDRLKWLIKNEKVKENGDNVGTSYIAKAIDYYCFHIKHLTGNQFIIENGHAWDNLREEN